MDSATVARRRRWVGSEEVAMLKKVVKHRRDGAGFSVPAAAAEIRTSPHKLRAAVKEGKVRANWIGKQPAIPPSEVERLKDAAKSKPTPLWKASAGRVGSIEDTNLIPINVNAKVVRPPSRRAVMPTYSFSLVAFTRPLSCTAWLAASSAAAPASTPRSGHGLGPNPHSGISRRPADLVAERRSRRVSRSR